MKKKIMNNEKMNQIISDAWANYSKKVIANNLQLIPAIDLPKHKKSSSTNVKLTQSSLKGGD